MNIYSIDFTGYYPVGAVAVVSADSPAVACQMLYDHLQVLGLVQNQCNTFEKLMESCSLIDSSIPKVTILLDGNY
jgi:hypothetical protein